MPVATFAELAMTLSHDQRNSIMRSSLGKWSPLPDPLWQQLAALFHPVDYERAAHLVLPGAPMQKFFFVARGLLRFYYIDAEGRAWNKSFVQEGSFAGAFSSYVLGLPAPYAVEALEPTDVLVARWAAPFLRAGSPSIPLLRGSPRKRRTH